MSLLKNTSFYAIGSLLPKVGSFIFLPIFLKYLSKADYGIISSLFVLNVLFIVLFSWALPRAIYRLYYEYDTEDEKKKFLGTVLLSVGVISLISVLLVFIFQDQVQRIYRSIPFTPYFALAIGIVFFQVFHEIPNILLQVKEKAKTFVTINVLLFFVKSGLILYFLIVIEASAASYLKAELIVVALFLPVYYIYTYKFFILKWNRQIFRNLLHFSIPLMPVIISAWILNLSDRIFIEQYFTQEEVGVYSLGYQIAGLVLIVAGAFKQAYDPYFYKIANNTSLEDGKKQLYETNFVFLMVMMFGCFVIALFADEGIKLFFDKGYYSAILVVPIIALAYLISQNSALLNVMMYQEKETKVIMYITLFCAIINIALNYILIPRFGVFGAAWATVISFLLVFILSYRLAQKAYFIPYNWTKLLSALTLFIGVFFLFFYLKTTNIWLSIFYKVIIVLSLGSILFYRNRDVFRKIAKFK